MKLAIYSLKDILYQGDSSSLTCPTTNGEITVLDHHRPLITVLKTGVVRFLDNNHKEQYIPISSGFLEVARGRTRLLLSS